VACRLTLGSSSSDQGQSADPPAAATHPPYDWRSQAARSGSPPANAPVGIAKLTDVGTCAGDRRATVQRQSRWMPYCLIQECSRTGRALPHQNAPDAASVCQPTDEKLRRLNRLPVVTEPPRRREPNRLFCSISEPAFPSRPGTGPSPQRAPWHTPAGRQSVAAAPYVTKPGPHQPGQAVLSCLAPFAVKRAP
jgi:hypothetical protein